MKKLNSIIYVSNAGVLINLNNKKILIDGLCNSELPIYKNPPAEIRNQMIKGISPFDNIDLMLISHHHGDHFDPYSIGEFLKLNSNTTVISTNEVISRIKTETNYENLPNLIGLNPTLHGEEKITAREINIQAISMTHDGKDFEHIPNLAFIIKSGINIMHTGDSSPSKENYSHLNLLQDKVDLLIAPFPYVGLPSAREIIRKYINPRKIAVVHMPHKELDSFGWINATKKSCKSVENDFIETHFLEDIGQSLNICR